MTPERIAELRILTNYAGSKGVPFILDNHTFKWRPPPEQVRFWTGFAKNFPDDGSVLLDIVNEPRGFNDPVITNDWLQWAHDANQIISGLRAKGIRHPILIEYPQWSATFRFDKREPHTRACESAACALDRSGGLRDPLGRTYISAHRYFDAGSAGGNNTCIDKTSGWVSFAAALRKRGLKAYITESAFGSSNNGVPASCEGVAREAIAALKANKDVLLGITWWGGGRIWPENYLFKIEPKKATRFRTALTPYTLLLRGEDQ
jgi:hypothetical protein